MKLLRSVFLCLSGVCFSHCQWLCRAADYRLNVQYSLSDVTTTATGTKVTLNMTINNTGDAALNNITIVMMEPLKLAVPHKQPLSSPAFLQVKRQASHGRFPRLPRNHGKKFLQT